MISNIWYTLYPIKYAHDFVLLSIDIVISSAPVQSCDSFKYIFDGYFIAIC